MRIQNLVVVAGLALSAAACHKQATSTGTGTGSTPASDKKLFDRLGGMDGITAVVDDFVTNVGADARINARFVNADLKHLKEMLVAQICNASGGPCEYKGKDMLTTHKGMNIKDAEFDALVEDLVKSLDKFKVGPKEKADLLGALGPMKPQIVGV